METPGQQAVLRVALASLDQRWEDKAANFARAAALAAESRANGAGVIILPEMTLTGFSVSTTTTAEDERTSPTVRDFRALARETGIDIVFGVTFARGKRAANTLVHVTAAGRVAARYVKIHPFSFAGETKHFVKGDRLATSRIGPFRVGFTICYDLRFPELYTALGRRCDLIVNIANWPARRVHHWRTLLQARAIENQVFVAGVNRIGVDGKGHAYEPSSMVVDPNGLPLPATRLSPELEMCDVDRGSLAGFREKFNTVADRNTRHYRRII